MHTQCIIARYTALHPTAVKTQDPCALKYCGVTTLRLPPPEATASDGPLPTSQLQVCGPHELDLRPPPTGVTWPPAPPPDLGAPRRTSSEAPTLHPSHPPRAPPTDLGTSDGPQQPPTDPAHLRRTITGPRAIQSLLFPAEPPSVPTAPGGPLRTLLVPPAAPSVAGTLVTSDGPTLTSAGPASPPGSPAGPAAGPGSPPPAGSEPPSDPPRLTSADLRRGLSGPGAPLRGFLTPVAQAHLPPYFSPSPRHLKCPMGPPLTRSGLAP